MTRSNDVQVGIRFERFNFIGRKYLNIVREIKGQDRTGRNIYETIAVAETEEDASSFCKRLNEFSAEVERLEKEVEELKEELKSEHDGKSGYYEGHWSV